MKQSLFGVIALFFTYAYPQITITGKVLDGDTGEPIPFVTIYALRSKQMAISDLHGTFQLRVDSVPDTLVFQHLNYMKRRLIITGKEKQLGKIIMEPKAIELPEVTIHAGPDPAEILLSHIRKRRKEHVPENYTSYHYTSYNLVRVYLPDSVLERLPSKEDSLFQRYYAFVWESVTKRWYQRGKEPYEQVLATRISGLPDATFPLTPTQIQDLSFYSDYVKVLGVDFFGILHPRSKHHYRFRITDTLITAEGDSIFTLYFEPRKEKANHFEGKAVVTSHGYAILAVEGRAYFPAYMPFFSQVIIQQIHKKVNGYYFPVQLDTKLFYPVVITDTIGSSTESDSAIVKQFSVTALFHFQSYIDSIKVGEAVETIPTRSVNVEVATTQKEKIDSILFRYRVAPEDTKIIATYPVIDSALREVKIIRLVGKLRKLSIGAYPLAFFDIALGRFVGGNQVEGFRIGLGGMTNEHLLPWGGIGGFVAYGFQDKKWKYETFGYLKPFKQDRWFFRIGYSYDIIESGRMGGEIPDRKTMVQAALFPISQIRDFFVNQMDYYEKGYVEAYFPILRTLSGRLGFYSYHVMPADSYRYQIRNGAQGETGMSGQIFPDYRCSIVQASFRWAPRERYYLEKGHIFIEKQAKLIWEFNFRKSVPFYLFQFSNDVPNWVDDFYGADMAFQFKTYVGRHSWDNLIRVAYASQKAPYFFLYHLPTAGEPNLFYSPFGYQMLSYSRYPAHFTVNAFSVFALTNVLKIDKKHSLDILVPLGINYLYRYSDFYQYHLNRPVAEKGWYGEIGVLFQDLIPLPVLESFSPGVFVSTRNYRFQNWRDHIRFGIKQSLRF